MGPLAFDLMWRPKAEDDLIRIVDHIAEDAPVAAAALLQAIQDKAHLLRQNPQLGRAGRPGLPDGVRELVVHPNYLLFYRLLKRRRFIEILAVKHAARHFP